MKLGGLSKKEKGKFITPINFTFTLLLTVIFLALLIFSYYFKLVYAESIALSLISFTAPITVFNYLHREQDYLKEIIIPLIEKSKVIEDPTTWLNEMINYTWYGFVISALLGLLIYVESGELYYSLGGGLVVILTFFYPWLKSFDLRNSLASQVEKELPIVSIIMWSMSQLGYGVMKMIEELKSDETYAHFKGKSKKNKKGIILLGKRAKSDEEEVGGEKYDRRYLKAIPREFLKIHRDFVLFNIPPEEAIVREAKDHPHKIFERLLLGAVSISRSGGNLSEFMNRITVEVMDELKRRWEAFGKAAANMGELAMLFLLILPLFAIWFAVSANNPIYGVDSVAFFMVPLMGFALYMYLSLNAPPEDVKMSGNIKWGIVGLAVSILVLLLLTFFKVLSLNGYWLWLYFLTPIMAFSALYGYPLYKRIKEKNEADERLPIFVRSVAELIRSTGDNLYNALKKLEEGDVIASTVVKMTTFGKVIDETIKKYLTTMVTVGHFKPKTDSWLVNTVFESLMEMDRQGVLKYNIFTRLAEITDAYYDAMQARKRALYTFIGTSVIAPAIMAGVIVLTIYVLHSIAGLVQIQNLNVQGVNGITFADFTNLLNFFLAFINIGNYTYQMLPSLELMIAETSVIFGILLAKASDGTIKSTFRIFQVSMIGVVSIIIMQIALAYVAHAPTLLGSP
ncbi:type II secretion system F family protein [Sulfolobaceae archaeon RB850M]